MLGAPGTLPWEGLTLTVNDRLIFKFQEALSPDLCRSALLNHKESQQYKVIYQQEEE